MFFHRGPTRHPSQPWDFQKSPAQLALSRAIFRSRNKNSLKILSLETNNDWLAFNVSYLDVTFVIVLDTLHIDAKANNPYNNFI